MKSFRDGLPTDIPISTALQYTISFTRAADQVRGWPLRHVEDTKGKGAGEKINNLIIYLKYVLMI